MKLRDYTINLELRGGIYYSPHQREISYPEKGNEVLFDLEENSFWFSQRNKVIAEIVKKYSQRGFFFDIGGGNGFVSKALENEGIQTILVEPGIDGCRNAQKRGLTNVICATLEDSDFADGSLPNIGLFDVVEHIQDHISFLRMIHKYVSPDGLVFITVPAYQSLWSNEDVDAGHYRRYTLRTLESVLRDTGFKPVYSTYMFALLPIPIFLFRSFPSKLGIHKKSDSPEKYAREHNQRTGIFNKVMQWFWKKEYNSIKKGSKIPFGSSCLMVAKKI